MMIIMFLVQAISQITSIESEFLPPHVLVMFPVDKRHDVKEIMDQFPIDVINVSQ